MHSDADGDTQTDAYSCESEEDVRRRRLAVEEGKASEGDNMSREGCVFMCDEPLSRAGVLWANHALIHLEDWCAALKCFVDAQRLKTDAGWLGKRF
jgi:hypothetical protein